MVFKSLKDKFPHITVILNRFSFWKNSHHRTQIEQIHSKGQTSLSEAKQVELERLCNELFKRKELITSGKLQFIGLAKIKKRMGKKWEGLSKIVYNATEEVIDKYLDKGDIFIRYKDDTYIIIFAHAETEESRLKAALIAEEIRRRLFELDEDELKDIEIRQAVSEIRTAMLMDSSYPGGMFGMMDDSFDDWDNGSDLEEEVHDEPLPEIRGVDVGTAQYRKNSRNVTKSEITPVDIEYSYLPLWDTQSGALTTYLCLASDGKNNLLDSHRELYKRKTIEEKVEIDKAILRFVAAELMRMEKDGRKFFIVCPVQHETLFKYESYEAYKALLSQIPLTHRKSLMLLAMNMESGTPPKKAYWFAKPLRTLCPYVMAEVPLRRDLNFRYINESGVNVTGVKLDGSLTEHEIITILNGFCSKAKSLKVPKTFVLGVDSLSITTSAVCAGFDFLGGAAVHDAIDKPETVHRYHYEDLLANLKNRKAVT